MSCINYETAVEWLTVELCGSKVAIKRYMHVVSYLYSLRQTDKIDTAVKRKCFVRTQRK
jgi:hypothetical protein